MKVDTRKIQLLLLVAVLLLIVSGCRDQEEGGQTMKTNDDVEHAKELWKQIESYENWTVPKGFEGWQDGKSPHGSILRYYVNADAEEDLMKDGAVIVKENYSEQSEDALKSVTVMEKRTDYDPETNNWFYVKYSPNGEVMENAKGMKLAGLIGKGMAEGCIPCHSTAGGDDYLFMND